jgi:hypothetical protein
MLSVFSDLPVGLQEKLNADADMEIAQGYRDDGRRRSPSRHGWL